jgi:hypothetical protein
MHYHDTIMCEDTGKQCNGCDRLSNIAIANKEFWVCSRSVEFRNFWVYCKHYEHVNAYCLHKHAKEEYCDEESCPLINRIEVSGMMRDELDKIRTNDNETYEDLFLKMIETLNTQNDKIKKLEDKINDNKPLKEEKASEINW